MGEATREVQEKEITDKQQLLIAQKFISSVAFMDKPHCGDLLSQCKKCGEAAWLPRDVKHKKKCEIGKILEGYWKELREKEN